MRALVSAALGIGLAIAGGMDIASAQSDPNVTTFHNSANRNGVFLMPGLGWSAAATMHLDPNFNATIPNENVYAEPLYYLPPRQQHGLVIVATMSDTVRAFHADTGQQVWATVVGTPVPSSALPCDGQNPTGIDGTPVIDEANGNIYFDAEVMINNVPKQQIFGLSLKDGSILPGWPVDMETALANIGFTGSNAFSSPIQDQRGGMLLMNGNLYLAYGGHGGDCGNYHGWVVGLHTSPAGVFGAFSTTSIQASSSKGGIWGPGGVTSDGTSLYVTTGNTAKGTNVWSGGEAVIKLDPALLKETDFFTPSNWQALDQNDLDMGASGPLPIDIVYKNQTKHWLWQVGKSGIAYVENRASLGGIGGNLLTGTVSTAKVRTAPVAYRTNHTIYVAFSISTPGGTCAANPSLTNVGLTAVAVRVNPPSMTVEWCESLVTAGTPIVTLATTQGDGSPIVWIAGVQGDGMLHAYAPDDGHVLFGGGGIKMSHLARFSTILAAEGHLYIAGSSRLYAFTFTP